MKAKPNNYDYTAAQRSAARRNRAAMTLPATTLDAKHAAALHWIAEETGLSPTSIVRLLILDEAKRRGAPVEQPE